VKPAGIHEYGRCNSRFESKADLFLAYQEERNARTIEMVGERLAVTLPMPALEPGACVDRDRPRARARGLGWFSSCASGARPGEHIKSHAILCEPWLPGDELSRRHIVAKHSDTINQLDHN
jgi:hypothetical protein